MSIALAVLSLFFVALFGVAQESPTLEENRRSQAGSSMARLPAAMPASATERPTVALASVGSISKDSRLPQRNAPVTTLVGLAVLLFMVGSMIYVYRFRGTTRYTGFGQYVRKSWPIFAPMNCLLYLATCKEARGAVVDSNVVPQLALLKQNWTIIRDEALALQAAGEIDAAALPNSPGYYDVGFRTFYKYGWRKFYLSWYGYTHHSAQRACPRTVELLARLPSINGAMFSFLPPGGALTLHSDPLACSLRYHLGLATPERENCFIEVDGVRRAWMDGQDFIFDETYPHFARNDSNQPRLILMCDVERPMHLGGRIFNRVYRRLAGLTIVPNTSEDERGFASAAFAGLTPLLARSKALKASNRALYKLAKIIVNGTLLSILLLVLIGIVNFAGWLLS